MYANVVVLTYQSPDIDSYTYEIPKDLEAEIKVGQLVSIPFGKRNPTGVILNTKHHIHDTSLKIRPISSIIRSQPILLPHQIELLQWLTAYYHAPMVNCLQTMLPPIPKRPAGKSTVYNLQSTTQTLVLLPSINQIPETLAKYPNAKNYVVYHNELKDSEKLMVWQKISSGNVDYIFGSRLSIFVPSPNLSQIIIYDEHDDAYKDERSPYFNMLTVAEKLEELTGCKIKIVDDSPKITTYFNHPNDIQIPKVSTKVEVVSMLSEKASGNKSPISDILTNYIKLGHQRKKRILLFLNKKSDSGHVYCKNCKYSEFANTQPETCPECQSPNIFFNSLNINSLATLTKKIVPNANINIITDNKLQPTTYNLQPTIDIATAAVFYKLTPQKYDLVAHIRTDSVLNINDFTSQERLFWQITDLKKLTRGLLLLQTYNPEHLVIKTAAQNNYQEFFQKHLAQRKMLSYPPFSLLVKLSLKGKKEDVLEEKAQRFFDNLNRQLTVHGSQISALGPYKSFFTKSNIKYNIILKVKTGDYTLATREKTLKYLEPIFEKVPKDVQITVEPSNLN